MLLHLDDNEFSDLLLTTKTRVQEWPWSIE